MQGPWASYSYSLVKRYITIQNSPVSSAKWSGAPSSYNSPCQYTISRSGFCLQWHAEFQGFHSHLIMGKRKVTRENVPLHSLNAVWLFLSEQLYRKRSHLPNHHYIWTPGGRIPRWDLVSSSSLSSFLHPRVCTFMCTRVCTCLAVCMEVRGWCFPWSSSSWLLVSYWTQSSQIQLDSWPARCRDLPVPASRAQELQA